MSIKNTSEDPEKATYEEFQAAVRNLAAAEKEMAAAQDRYRKAVAALHPFALEAGNGAQ